MMHWAALRGDSTVWKGSKLGSCLVNDEDSSGSSLVICFLRREIGVGDRLIRSRWRLASAQRVGLVTARCVVFRLEEGLLLGVVAVDSGLRNCLGEVQSKLVCVSGVSGVSRVEYRADCLMGVCGLLITCVNGGSVAKASLDLITMIQSLSLEGDWSRCHRRHMTSSESSSNSLRAVLERQQSLASSRETAAIRSPLRLLIQFPQLAELSVLPWHLTDGPSIIPSCSSNARTGI